MPKLAKNVQIRRKVSKYVANAWRWRTPAGDRSMAAGCLDKICTVYKGVRFRLRAVAADFHDTAQAIANTFTSHRHFSIIVSQFDWFWKRVKTVVLMCALNPHQFDASWKRVKTVCMWFLTSVLKLSAELNASRYSLLRWWNRRKRTHRWMPRILSVDQSGDAHYNSVAFHDANR